MKGSHSIYSALVILVSLAIAVQADVGRDNSLAVFITYPEGEYDIGSEVVVTVHIFDDGEYYDPQLVTLKVDYSKDHLLSRVGTGRYTCSFIINQSDLDEDGCLRISSTAEDTDPIGRRADDYVSIYPSAMTDFDVRIGLFDVEDRFPRPGQSVEFQVLCTYAGLPVDPDYREPDVSYFNTFGEGEDIWVTKKSTGIFEGRFTVPRTQKISDVYQLSARSEYTCGTLTHEAYEILELMVSFFDVWVQVANLTEERVDLVLYAYDNLGLPLNGADVFWEYYYNNEGAGYAKANASAVTDANGRIDFGFDIVDLSEIDPMVSIYGGVTYKGHSQRFAGQLRIKEDSWNPNEESGLVVYLLTEGPLKPGTSATIENVAWSFGSLLVDYPITVYVTHAHSIIWVGEATTGADGRFSLTVDMPSSVAAGETLSSITVHCQTNISGVFWEDVDWVTMGDGVFLVDQWVEFSGNTTIAVEPFYTGEEAIVTLSHPGADGINETAIVMMGYGDVERWDEMWSLQIAPEYAPWNSGIVFLRHERDGFTKFVATVPCEWSDGTYSAAVKVPSFIPQDARLFFIGYLQFSDQAPNVRWGAIAQDLSPAPTGGIPVVVVEVPREGVNYEGIIEVIGSASDDTGISFVEIRVDKGEWRTVDGTTHWRYELDTSGLYKGEHVLEARSNDGVRYSRTVKVTFLTGVKETKKDSPGFGLELVISALAASILILSIWNKR